MVGVPIQSGIFLEVANQLYSSPRLMKSRSAPLHGGPGGFWTHEAGRGCPVSRGMGTPRPRRAFEGQFRERGMREIYPDNIVKIQIISSRFLGFNQLQGVAGSLFCLDMNELNPPLGIRPHGGLGVRLRLDGIISETLLKQVNTSVSQQL